MERTPHGFELEPELNLALRGPVPREAIDWVEEQTGSRVVAQSPLEGGTSSAIHRLVLLARGGAEHSVVLRRYVLDWVRDEPEIPGNEARALTLLGRQAAVPAPALVAADPDGIRTGVPTILMSAIPGSVIWNPVQIDPFLRELAALLPQIHDVEIDPELQTWEPYPAEVGMPPGWSRHPAAWERAVDERERAGTPDRRVVVHRDFHPGNVLWSEGGVTGVVDWASCSVGPPEEDVAHCRVNLALHLGPESADRFLQHWLELTGRTSYDHRYDLLTALSMADSTPSPGLDAFVAAAVDRLA